MISLSANPFILRRLAEEASRGLSPEAAFDAVLGEGSYAELLAETAMAADRAARTRPLPSNDSLGA